MLRAVVPVLFEHSLRKASGGDVVVTVAQVLGMEPAAARLRNPATDSEVVLALRVLQGCCLLCPPCAAAAHRYNAVKVRRGRPHDRASCVHLGKYCIASLIHCSLRVVQTLHCPVAVLIHQVCPAFAVGWEILIA